MFEFLLSYVRRIKSDLDWRELMKKNPEKPFLLFVTPSYIAFILSLIKNGLGMWEQARRQKDNWTQVEIKALPLFTKGEGQKRESGKTVWNNDGAVSRLTMVLAGSLSHLKMARLAKS